MNIKFLGLALSSLIALGEAKNYGFNVISILGEGTSLGVKYGETVRPLTATTFPLFTGIIEANNIDKYKYVALDQNGNIIEEETIERTYSDDNKLNEVYNRENKKVEISTLPEPFKPMFPMGSEKFQPFPNNVIYNIYAQCDPEVYEDISNNPFAHGGNNQRANCTINIVSPESTFQSTGSIKVLGYGSRKFKKLSYSLKFDKKFLGRKSAKIRAMASDPTLMREILSTQLYKAVGVPVQESAYARVFINDDAYGLYILTDKINSRWIGSYIHGDPKAKIGNSYELVSSHPNGPYAELKYLGEDYTAYDESRTYIVNEYDETTITEDDDVAQWKPLIDFTKRFEDWVNTYGEDMSDNAVKALEEFLNIEALLRLLAIETLIVPLDNFWLLMSNVNLYYNPERNNYVFLPYDFDEALNGDSDNQILDKNSYISDCFTWATAREDVTFEHYFTNNILKHPQIKQRYDVILAKATRELFTSDVIANYIHSLADLIRDDVSWNFGLIDSLDTSYDGFVNHFTLEDFNSNQDYGIVDYNSKINVNDAPFGILTWVDIRGDSCRNYTANVDTSDNSNISDNYDVKLFTPSNSSSSSSSSGSRTSFQPLSLWISAFLLLLSTLLLA